MPRSMLMPMKARRPALTLSLALALTLTQVLMPAAGVAGTAAEPDSLAMSADGPAAEVGAVPTPSNDPLDLEVAVIRDTFRQHLTEATARYGAAGDAAAAMAAQREIVALKHRLERDLLDLQLRLARERGDAEAIAELELARTAVAGRLEDEAHQPAPANTPGRAAR